ncbi:MAG TPA: DUF3187 family protein [Nevskiaceae bacterium]|nr:DUF3187 family protein [Nevskiaceae bacterium]
MQAKTAVCGALALLCALACAPPAQAQEFFPVYNQGSLARAFDLPALGRPRVLAPDASAWYGAVDLSNEYYTDSSAREFLLEDGETARFSLSYARGIGSNVEVSATLPLLVQGGGFIDHTIEQWHRIFGLPNGGREFAPRQRYQYTYTRDGVTVMDAHESGTRLGDVLLGAGWQWTSSTALRAQLKLPTGDKGQLAGGNAGGALWLDTALPFDRASTLSGYLSGGVSANGSSGPLGDLQQRVLGFGGGGLGWQAFNRVQLVGQLYFHSPLYKDTDISGLKKPGGQLLLGANVRVAPGTLFKIAFQEDIVTNSSPDFSLHFGLSL